MVLPLLQTAMDPGRFTFLGIRVLEVIPEETRLLVVCGATLVLFVLKGSVTMLRYYSSSLFINRLRRFWSAQIMDSYLGACYTEVLMHRQGVLLNNMVHEPTYASKAMRDLVELLANTFMALGLVTLLVMVNWQLTAVVGLFCALVLIAFWRITQRYATDVGRRKIALNQEITQIAAEAIAGIRQLKIFSLERRVGQEFRRKLGRLVRVIVGFRVVSGMPLILGELTIVIIVVGILLFYRYELDVDLKTVIPVLGLFMVSSVRFFMSVSRLISQRMSIVSYWPSLKLVRQLSRRAPDREPEQGGREFQGLRARVSFSHVSFKFENGFQLFDDLSLNIPKGKITAVVGLSGAGKSTICDLLSRFFIPTQGQILVDDERLEDLSVRSWRRKIGYVSQETFLFDTTIKENIAIGVPEGATDEQVYAVGRMAGVDEFVSRLPHGYDTPIGVDVNLSGGQRQRIAIARALVRDPDLIILDEATSSLDARMERRLLETIKKIAGNKAVLFITHRLSSLWIADYIYYLEKGQVVEQGSYEDLMAEKGSFWRLQQLASKESEPVE
ncbi:MAG: ABC transporter ATP-binding protein [Deltaproteobacteria bacterium]|nr:ABC transporter ATP-binding protein [Deltaproteobacteria bacterium]MBW1922862.1 ABC transporter ATP-binding protein [Deltaproteobacteria bacterium]MBW2007597.1 ABC transporter ATP-binding protein [Deltaproteobacteria bacterium]